MPAAFPCPLFPIWKYQPQKWAPLKDGDWSIIETIISIDETKAIAQAVMEFLFLGYKSHEAYEEAYEDLFDCFCLNRKAFGEDNFDPLPPDIKYFTSLLNIP